MLRKQIPLVLLLFSPAPNELRILVLSIWDSHILGNQVFKKMFPVSQNNAQEVGVHLTSFFKHLLVTDVETSDFKCSSLNRHIKQ